MKTSELIETCEQYFGRLGYGRKEPQGLLNPYYPDTFNPCAGHAEINELANRLKLEYPIKWVTTEPVFRHLDLPVVGHSKYHTSLFEMMTHVDARKTEDSSKERTIEEIVGLLSELGIDKKRLHVTVFDGARLLGKDIPADAESKEIWEKYLGESKVHPLKSTKNIEFTQVEGEQIGPRCEIYFERDGDLIEVGTTVFDNHVYSKSGFKRIPNGIYGSAIGVERVGVVVNGYGSVYENDTFRPFLDLVRSYVKRVGDQRFVEEGIISLADHLKSALLISAEGQEKTQKTRRGQRFSALINDINRITEMLGVEGIDDLCDSTARIIETLYASRYPFYREIDPSKVSKYLKNNS